MRTRWWLCAFRLSRRRRHLFPDIPAPHALHDRLFTWAPSSGGLQEQQQPGTRTDDIVVGHVTWRHE